MNRSVRNGIVPPAWEKMNRMSGKRAAAPLNSRLAMVRVVSVPYSMTAGGMSGTRFRQQLAAVGCVYTTAWRVANDDYPVREISMAKLYAARIATEVADECIQIHGGAGYMKEYGIERAWRDMRLNRIGAGTDEIMLDVIGRSYGL